MRHGIYGSLKGTEMKRIFYDWGGANEWLFHLINDVNGRLLDKFMSFGTSLGTHKNFAVYQGIVILVTLFCVSKATTPEEKLQQTLRWLAVIAVFNIAYLVDALFIGTLKPLLDFPRPPLALPQGSLHIVGEPEHHHSFPSGHASFAMLVTAALWPVFNRHWKIFGCFFVVWVCVSRISVGAHFPADVLGGATSSFLIVWLVRTGFNRFMETRVSREPG